MAQVYLGLGANLGEKEENIKQALAELSKRQLKVLKTSGIITTSPYGVLDQPDFANAVCLVETSLSPHELLCTLKQLEQHMGRVATSRWGPRVLDLDILLYEDRIICEPDLIIPHPDMLSRFFVLRPLVEIAPDVLHPVSKKSMRAHLAELENKEQ